nr:protein FAR1-RELATED SEQUENCE 5-like [Ipomoea batatas]
MADMEVILEQIFGETSLKNAESPSMQDDENINGDARVGEQSDNEENRAYECIPDCDESIKPLLGQQFSTLDEGVGYYKEYAAFVGFDVRSSTVKRNRYGDVELKYLLCSREGYTVTKEQRSTTTGCNLSSFFSLQNPSIKWFCFRLPSASVVRKQLIDEVRISSSYTATKVLFNLDCQEFADFRNSANNSQSPMVVSTIRDLYERAESKMQVPVEFEQLRNKSMVFRINLKNEHIRNPAKPISVLSESESGDEAISPIVQANLKLKGVANDQDEVDTGAIKRCLLDQFSSSQNLKKCRPLVIKEEKTL